MTNPNFDNDKLRERYNPEGSRLRHDQMELLEMLKVVAKICDEHNIRWWLSSGTLLGAARHKGFIPWDDDIDIVMLRRDAKRLEKILLEMESDEYVYHTMKSDPEYLNPFGKFRKRHGEVHTEGALHRHHRYRGQFLDIFSIERCNYPSARMAMIAFTNLRHLTTYVERRWLRRIVISVVRGLCFGIINPLLRVVGSINPRGEYHYTMGTGWAKHTFFMEDTFPLTTIEFEGCHFPAPRNTDAYLTKVYGDWRALPSEDVIRRSIHCNEYIEEIYG